MHRCIAGSCQGWWASQIRRCQPRSVSACLSVDGCQPVSPSLTFCLLLHVSDSSFSCVHLYVPLPASVCLSIFLFLISVTRARCILSSNSCASNCCHRSLKKTVSMRRPGACGMFSDVAQVKFCFLISPRYPSLRCFFITLVIQQYCAPGLSLPFRFSQKLL